MVGVVTLFSGSEANSSLIINGQRLVLIDAGASASAILKAVSSLGFDPEAIEGAFITHEHSDHTKGIRVLLKKLPKLKLYMSRGTADALDLDFDNLQIIKCGEQISCGGCDFVPFSTPHDAEESFGYVVYNGGRKQIGYATDIGFITDEIRISLIGCKTVVLESNHDENMLMFGRYPYELKRRIMSNRGHLSNEACDRFIQELVVGGTENIILAHLSCENNMPEIALAGAKNAASEKAANICIAPKKEPSEAYYA